MSHPNQQPNGTEITRFDHTLRVPDANRVEMADETMILTAQGAEVTPGVFVQFDRLPECAYRLQAFHDTSTPEYCTAGFHVADDTASETPFTTDLMIPWVKLADLIDEDAAKVWDVNPANE